MKRRIKHIYNTLAKIILDILYPPKCMACNLQSVEDVNLICHACWSTLEFIHHPMCQKCGVALPVSYLGALCQRCKERPLHFDIARSVLRYNHTSKDMLHRFKFEDKTQYAKRFAKLIHTSYSAIIKEAQLIIAVPQHKKRLKQRRYNHAALIAYEIAKIADKQFSPNALQKLRYTSLQANLGYAQRQQNLQNAFLANSNVQDKVILLVDDIMTTGATASECALALKKAGALKVFVTTIARTY